MPASLPRHSQSGPPSASYTSNHIGPWAASPKSEQGRLSQIPGRYSPDELLPGSNWKASRGQQATRNGTLNAETSALVPDSLHRVSPESILILIVGPWLSPVVLPVSTMSAVHSCPASKNTRSAHAVALTLYRMFL
jgi:hypothetical protein